MPYVVQDWMGEFVDVPAGQTAAELAAALVKVGLEEEAIHGSGVRGPVVVGRVLEAIPEPQKNGKTINWCQVDVGEHGVPNGDGTFGPRGIVCGAHNFAAGDLVVVSLPGAELPGGFVISARKTYGHVSDGMICSVRELGIGEDHTGILVLRKAADASAEDPTPGTDALPLLGLADEVLEINVTPDRGYCFSVRGVAREFALSTGARFTDPGLAENLAAPLPEATDDGFPVRVVDEAPIHGVAGCDRFVTRIVRGVDPAAPTPEWMKRRLEKSGMRSISLAVDITNYVMLELGQPLHAYDLAALAGPIVVRRARPGERLTTLDDVDRALDPEDLLITDSPDGAEGSRILGLAGVMGGAYGEQTAQTSDVLVEAAHFDPVTVARTSRRHKLPSEAAKRFERGSDPQLPPVAAQRVVDLLVSLGGGVADSAVSDLDTTTPPEPISMQLGEPERLVGVAFTPDQVIGTLSDIGCEVAVFPAGEELTPFTELTVTPPSWRPDLTGPADLVEEVARIVGYDAIEPVLPAAPPGRGLTPDQRRRRAVARTLAEAGLVEVLSYPFIGEAQLDALGLDSDDAQRSAVRLVNPLTDAQPLMRTSVLSTLIATAQRNIARGAADVSVYEMGSVSFAVPGNPPAPALPGGVRPTGEQLAALADALPTQDLHVAAVLTGDADPAGWWGQGRRAEWSDALELARKVAASVDAPATVHAAQRAPWHPGRCAELRAGDVTIGYAGELHPKVLEKFGLPARSVAFEIDLTALFAAAPSEPQQATPVSTYPLAKEDVALVVDESVPAADVLAAVREGAGDLAESVSLFDVFRGEQIGEGKKSLAFSLRLRADDRTLSAEDAAAVRHRVVKVAHKRVGAELRA